MSPDKARQLAEQYQVSQQAVETLWQALVSGNGSMAQFNHSELGGAGQWMAGGMTMVGDMFNHRLKYVVDQICTALAPAAREAATHKFDFVASDPVSESGQAHASQPQSSHRWWPSNWGAPNSSGSQNDMSYAYFSGPHRLMIRQHGETTVYDTLDHVITGVSQQQSQGQALTFSSQHGPVRLDALPKVSVSHNQEHRVSEDSRTNPKHGDRVEDVGQVTKPQAAEEAKLDSQSSDPLATLERLGKLRELGLITQAEFDDKKRELLKRI